MKKYSLDLQIQNLKEEKKNSKQDNRRGNDKQVKRVVKEFLTMQNPSKEILRQLIERIEFDQEKNITIQLTFSNPDKKIM